MNEQEKGDDLNKASPFSNFHSFKFSNLKY